MEPDKGSLYHHAPSQKLQKIPVESKITFPPKYNESTSSEFVRYQRWYASAAQELAKKHERLISRETDTSTGNRNEKTKSLPLTNWKDDRGGFLPAYEYLCNISEARDWIGRIIKSHLTPTVHFEDALRDGVILADIVQRLDPHKTYRICRHPTLQPRHLNNIAIFLRFLASVKLPEQFRFEFLDLYEDKNIPKVIFCIHALSRHLREIRSDTQLMANMLGRLQFNEFDLEKMQDRLDKSAVTMPSFAELPTSFPSEIIEYYPKSRLEEVNRVIHERTGNEYPREELSAPEPRWEQVIGVTNELTGNEYQVIEIQAHFRGAILRSRVGEIRQRLWKLAEGVIKMQSLIRGTSARKEVSEYQQHMQIVMVKFQSAARGYIIRKKNGDKEAWWKEREKQVILLQRFSRTRRSKIQASSNDTSFQSEVLFQDGKGSWIGRFFSETIRSALSGLFVDLKSTNSFLLRYLPESSIGPFKRWSNQYWEPPLEEGKTRIRWTCQCNERLWDDFVELHPGAAEDMRQSLDLHERSSLKKPLQETQRSAHFQVSNFPAPLQTTKPNKALPSDDTLAKLKLPPVVKYVPTKGFHSFKPNAGLNEDDSVEIVENDGSSRREPSATHSRGASVDLGLSDTTETHDLTSPERAGGSKNGRAAVEEIQVRSMVSSLPDPLNTAEQKFLLLCYKKTNDTLRLSQLDLKGIADDFQLFNMLQAEYASRKSSLSRFFTTRKIVSVNFRKLERHPRDRVVILSSPDILPRRVNPSVCHSDHRSPKCDTTYDIHPIPPDLSPYLGRNGLAHLLSHPHETDDLGNNLPPQTVWLQRFPKKEKSKLAACPPFQYGLGWGIEFEEAICVGRLMGLVTAAGVLAGSLFLACWWRVKGDLQGGAGMAAFLVACCAVVVAAVVGVAWGG